jgi:hypothetical protein
MPAISQRSAVVTPRILPKSMCERSRKPRVVLINTRPRANIPVNRIPMYEYDIALSFVKEDSLCGGGLDAVSLWIVAQSSPAS